MMTSPTLTISAREFYRLADSVAPFASTDLYGLPTIAAVRIEARGDVLLAMATDRFRIGMQRHRAPGEWSADFAVTLPLGSLRSMKSMFKPLRGMDSDLTLAVTDNGARLDVTAGGALMDLLSAQASYSLETADYPKFASVILDAFDREPSSDAFAVSPRLLADFGKVAANTLVVKASGTAKPLLFGDGEDFIGVLMPRRNEIGDAKGIKDADSWRALLDRPPAAKAPTKKRAAKKAVA